MGPRWAATRCTTWGERMRWVRGNMGKRMRTADMGPSVELPMGPRNAALGGGMAEAEVGMMGGGRRGQREEETEERGALSLQNEDPTPQDCWEKEKN